MDLASKALDNVNPATLSVSQLPTRQKRSAPRTGPDCRYDSQIFNPPSYLSQPFHDCSSSSDEAEPIDEQEIYDLISPLMDPEHPLSLGQLSVVNLPDIHISPSPALGVPPLNQIVKVSVALTPTVAHCSMASLLGLGVRVRLDRVLPPNYRVEVTCKENTHNQDEEVNKQLGDKERVVAAQENEDLQMALAGMFRNL